MAIVSTARAKFDEPRAKKETMSPFAFLGDGQENNASSEERTLEYVSTARAKFDEPSAKKEILKHEPFYIFR